MSDFDEMVEYVFRCLVDKIEQEDFEAICERELMGEED